MSKGFTIVELVVSIAIIAVLSSIVLFSVSQYINKGKNANISGSLATLIPAGDVWYNANNYNYSGFCTLPNSFVSHVFSQMPPGANPVCIVENTKGQAWLACAQDLVIAGNVFCVDSRGMKENITNVCSTITGSCGAAICQCP